MIMKKEKQHSQNNIKETKHQIHYIITAYIWKYRHIQKFVKTEQHISSHINNKGAKH